MHSHTVHQIGARPVYDGDGNRVRKSVSGVITYYLVDNNNPSGYAQVLEELSTVGSTPSRLYTYGLNLISQRQSGGTTSFYGYDGNDSTRLLTSSSGTISDLYTYDAFGNLISSVGSTPNNYLYSGEQYDPNLRFYYLRSRYMNPATGRFWTRDSFPGVNQDPSSLHKYLYVADNPIDNTDPSGQISSLDAAKYGRILHAKLGEDFTEKFAPFGISGPSVATILNDHVKIPVNTITALFPDLVDWNPANKEVYEIKPFGVGVVAGYLQLEGYLQLFNYFDPVKTWKPGSTYIPPLEVTLDPLTYAIVSPPERGVILYKSFSVKDFAKQRALNVGESESADVEDSVGISTLTTIIAF